MLVIEGPDLVGKTTAINRMRVLYPQLGYDKFGLPESSYIGTKPWLDRIKPLTIADRYAMSEVIYGVECRGRCNLDPIMLSRINAVLSEKGGMVVMVHATLDAYDKILDSCYDAKREAFSAAQCKRINQAYRQAQDQTWLGGKHRFKIDRAIELRVGPDGEVTRLTDSDIKWIAEHYLHRQQTVGA